MILSTAPILLPKPNDHPQRPYARPIPTTLVMAKKR